MPRQSLTGIERVAMARSNGGRRSKRDRSGHPFLLATLPSAASHRVAEASRLFKRRSRRRTNPSSSWWVRPVTVRHSFQGAYKEEIGTVVGISSSCDERFAWFEKRMDAELLNSGHVGTTTIDLFIFPIMHKGTYYMMSVSFKHSRFNIIDSSSAKKLNKEMYSGAAEELVPSCMFGAISCMFGAFMSCTTFLLHSKVMNTCPDVSSPNFNVLLSSINI